MRPLIDPDPDYQRPDDLRDNLDALILDLGRVVARDRWGRALMILGWVHLGFFGVCQALHDPSIEVDLRIVLLWVLEVATIAGVLRMILGRRWMRATPLATVVVRVWITFFILAFNVATINNLTGWDLDWFKYAWATLSTFGFATMAWVIHPWFLVPAVQMYVTDLLMVRHPTWIYAIYGASWWAALQGIGLTLESRRARDLVATREARIDDALEPIGAGAAGRS